MTGRTQAFSLGESFAENYAFTLLNETHNYKVEYSGDFPPVGRDANEQIKIGCGRRRIGLRKGFWELMLRNMLLSRGYQKILVGSTQV